MTTRSHPVPRFGKTAVAILESLYQHRLLSTRQIHRLHAPATRIQGSQRTLARLRQAQLTDAVQLPGRMRLWYLTDRGLDAVEAIPNRVETRRKQIPRDHAAGPLQQHTLAVNDVGIAFVEAARTRGDDCGPLAWRHEIAHPIGRPSGRRRSEQLIADAVLTYQLNQPAETSFHYRFVELDRANRATNDLARRLARYAHLYHHTVTPDQASVPVAGWTLLYPIFPGLLVVLAGEARHRLERRRQTVLDLCRQDPDLAATPQVRLSICLLDDLTTHGPFAPICRTPDDLDQPVDWLNNPNPLADSGGAS
ncbi:MAG: hypothetical protein GXY03_02570 [Solirubrobacterales bacterium]|nr:hypothetical protein [Solirubrobacterales bacterium]